MTETIYQVLDRIEAAPEVELPSGACSLDFLRAVYRNAGQPLSTRIRCAIAALPFEVPKLSVNANINASGFAARLETAMERRGIRTVIDATPIPKTPAIAPYEGQ